jgi:hypothetical protein
MVTLKSFISAIQQAIINANDVLQKKNDKDLIERYFTKLSNNIKPETGKELAPYEGEKYVANTVTLEYSVPTIDNAGRILAQKSEIKVPLITLVPLQLPQIEKIVLTSNFQIESVNGEVEIDFAKPRSGLFKKQKSNQCKLEITIKAQEAPDGLKILVDGYEAFLKRQLG